MAVIKPVVREKTLSESVYEQLKRGLISGEFSPGEKVTVRGIAEAADISFTPAREALGRLIAEGALINTGPKTVVVPKLTKDALEETAKIRQELEGLAASEAAGWFEPKDIEKLSAIQDALDDAMDRRDFRQVLRRNEEFHFYIYRKSGMPRLVKMIESCWLRVGPSLNLLYPEFSISRSGIKIHRSLIGALGSGNSQKARSLIEKDIQGGYRTLAKHIK